MKTAEPRGTVQEPAEVRAFCTRLKIRQLARNAVRLVETNLKPKRVRLELASDPEGDGEWLLIRADVDDIVDEVLENYSACKKTWLRLAPPAKREYVRFLYNIL